MLITYSTLDDQYQSQVEYFITGVYTGNSLLQRTYKNQNIGVSEHV